MLTLITGKAGSGKTSAVMQQIRELVNNKTEGIWLIVPEQYSHEAERELCAVCGSSISLYAEVLSFTGLCRRVNAELGGGAVRTLDQGGRMLCMAVAMEAIGQRLKVFGSGMEKTRMMTALLHAMDEMKTAGAEASFLANAAIDCLEAGERDLAAKLEDMALVMEAYDSVASAGYADPLDRLTRLAEQIAAHKVGAGKHVFIDGFIDFTMQELLVIRALLRSGADLTVCLTMDGLAGTNELFGMSRISALKLKEFAEEERIPLKEMVLTASATGKDPALLAFADAMFAFGKEHFTDENGAVELYTADSRSAECEFAAAKALELVQKKGCRWRDIAVAVRGFDEYRTTLESMFAHYGIPLYSTRKTSLLTRPLPALISEAYQIITGGWDTDDVISYLHTGLTGLEAEQADRLENYIFKWRIRGNAWLQSGDWKQNPRGFVPEETDEDRELLQELNRSRKQLAAPLKQLAAQSAAAETVQDHVRALADFMTAAHLPETLARRAETLKEAGRDAAAEEYRQLWNVLAGALEQTAAIAGTMEMRTADFADLFTTMLGQYEIGTIPVALDRVAAGDFDRMRSRHVRWLIVLGADDAHIPAPETESGLFSAEDRQRMLEMEIHIGGAKEQELWREFALIYHCLTIPSQGLILCLPAYDNDGNQTRESVVYSRAAALFGKERQHAQLNRIRMAAPAPALALAAGLEQSPEAEAARAYFQQTQPERLQALLNAANRQSESLSGEAVKALYGERLRLSASKVDTWHACRYEYFCKYGLKAEPYQPAGFTPPEIGTFFHDVLENTARAVMELGGFRKVGDEQLREITAANIRSYVENKMDNLSEKSARFIYLFRRLEAEVQQIVADMAEELRKSDFQPMEYEFDFSKATDVKPYRLGEKGTAMQLTGIADRIDGWEHEGKLYLRVADYKTGSKAFNLSDVWYGNSLQMLMYLFTLQQGGSEHFEGKEIVPAGIMYIPAKDKMVSASGKLEPEQVEKERKKKIRRSGLVLDEADVMNAWENGAAIEEKEFIPVHLNRSGKVDEENLASLEQMGKLAAHVETQLSEMAAELHRGSIETNPCVKGSTLVCDHCDYRPMCRFAAGEGEGNERMQPKLKAPDVWKLIEEEMREHG
ncbi:MAG: PD-(D/E)XK nuclease family protein [Oscillospiraceae bacterium]|nr:PD-(D/E)XK nuclease family protein [Oscillospiraceae bacterium]